MFTSSTDSKLHLRSIARRHGELATAGILEVAVFHSSTEALLRHQAGLPFPVIADPEEKLYAEFGVDKSLQSVFDPRAWGAIGDRTAGRFSDCAGRRGIGLQLSASP